MCSIWNSVGTFRKIVYRNEKLAALVVTVPRQLGRSPCVSTYFLFVMEGRPRSNAGRLWAFISLGSEENVGVSATISILSFRFFRPDLNPTLAAESRLRQVGLR